MELEVEWNPKANVLFNPERLHAKISAHGGKRITGGGEMWYARWRAPKDPEESKRMDEVMLNLCYARYPLENENA